MKKKVVKIHGKEELEAFQEYLHEEEYSPATIRKYMTDVRSFFRYLDKENTICKQNIMKYKEWLQKKYMVSSTNSMLASLNRFLDFIDAAELKVKRVKVQKCLMMEEEKNLTKDDFIHLRDTALNKGQEGLAMIMETIVSTGIRVSELQYITVDAVKSGKMEVNNKGKYRVVLIPDILKKRLLEFISCNQLKMGPVFVTNGGNPVDRSNLWAQMKRLCAEAGVPEKKVYPHNFRHLFARRYYQLTQDLTGLADILGHSSIEVTRIYTADTGRQYRMQMDKLDFLSNTEIWTGGQPSEEVPAAGRDVFRQKNQEKPET